MNEVTGLGGDGLVDGHLGFPRRTVVTGAPAVSQETARLFTVLVTKKERNKQVILHTLLPPFSSFPPNLSPVSSQPCWSAEMVRQSHGR